MGKDLRIGLAGATGALGQELLAVLDEAPWRPDVIVPLGRPSTAVPAVHYGDEQVAVEDLDGEDLASLDALLVALPREAAGAVVDRAAAAGVPVVDCSGSQLENLDVPLSLPWLAGGALDAERPRDVVAVPGPVAMLLASVLAPLARAGWTGASDATVLVPASAWGRDAIDELSRQVVALFNAGAPPRKVFPQGLAFDLLPLVGEAGATGWTGEEVRVVAEVARLTGGVRTQATLIATPTFSGIAATLRVAWSPERPLEELAGALVDAGVTVTDTPDLRKLPRPRRVEGHPGVRVGRIRRGLHGGDAHLWLAMDNLRTTAVAAVGTAAALLGQREAT